MHEKIWKHLLYDQEQDKSVPFHHAYSTLYWSISHKKEVKKNPYRKAGSHNIPVAENMFLGEGKPKNHHNTVRVDQEI